jgi:hypothetical protein
MDSISDSNQRIHDVFSRGIHSNGIQTNASNLTDNGDMTDGHSNYNHKGHSSSPQGNLEVGDKLEPIAIIGMDLKFPQDATSPKHFWEMLVERRSAMTEIPPERFNIDSFYRSGDPGNGLVSNLRDFKSSPC